MAAWTRVIRFVAKEDGKTHYGQLTDDRLDAGEAYASGKKITARVLSDSPLNKSAKLTNKVVTVKTLLSPLPADAVRTIRGLGAQYSNGSADFVPPPLTVLFLKPQTCIQDPSGPIFIPKLAQGTNPDYEVELCVVIGKPCRDVSEKDALDYVLGYTVTNDVTSRGLCAKGVQWGIGKGMDTWNPIGPVLIHPSQIRDPDNLELKSTVNGVLKQHSSTKNMVMSVRRMIHELSKGATLEPGSIILTGSPLPLDRVNDKDPWLKHGDHVVCWVEGIGSLHNTVVEEGKGALKAKL